VDPETKPAPLTVIVNPASPAFTACGFKNDTDEEDVWTDKFVLNWEQPPVRPNTASVAINHLRENIRIRSPSNHSCEMPVLRQSCEIDTVLKPALNPVLKKSAKVLPLLRGAEP
jgi:hypothetical protein